jgi:penicillin-binding protein 1C
MAGVYASMARALNHQTINKGIINSADFHPPNYVLNINAADHSGDAVKSNINIASKKIIATDKDNISGSSSRVGGLDATSIYFTFQAMKEVMRPGEEGLWQQFTSSQTIAWKTGTSFGFRDGWAIGVTPKNVVAVWVGNTDGEGRPGLIGIQTAAPILFDIFRLLPAVSWFAKPGYNFSYVPVCRQTGFRANIDCADIDTLFMPVNGIKSPLCPYHKMINLDAKGIWRVTDQCESPSAMQHKSWFILSPAMEFYYKQKNADYKILPSFKAGCENTDAGKAIEIIYPSPDAKIYVPLEINGEKGKTIFTAAHRRSDAKIYWSLDDNFVATTQHFHQVALNPTVGKHLITLVDENGVSVSRAFEIVDKQR